MSSSSKVVRKSFFLPTANEYDPTLKAEVICLRSVGAVVSRLKRFNIPFLWIIRRAISQRGSNRGLMWPIIIFFLV